MEMKQMADPEERGLWGESKRFQVQGTEVVTKKQRKGTLDSLESMLSKD